MVCRRGPRRDRPDWSFDSFDTVIDYNISPPLMAVVYSLVWFSTDPAVDCDFQEMKILVQVSAGRLIVNVADLLFGCCSLVCRHMKHLAAVLLSAAVVLSVHVGGLAHGETLAGSRPSIILVMTDDQGMGELSCMGNRVLSTPNLDRFYCMSTRFTDFHVSPTCASTRSAVFSGRHEFRNSVTHTIKERERMALSTTTLPQLLRKSGYVTGIFGNYCERKYFEKCHTHNA